LVFTTPPALLIVGNQFRVESFEHVDPAPVRLADGARLRPGDGRRDAPEEAAFEKDLAAKVKQHWIWPWAKQIRGLGTVTLGRLLAATGDLGGGPDSCPDGCQEREKDKKHKHRGFPTVAALWKFLGMAPGQRRKRGEKSGWSASGKVASYLIGEGMNKAGGGYKSLYYAPRRAAVLARPRIGPSGCPFGQEHVGHERKKDAASGWDRKTGQSRAIQCINEPGPHVHKTKPCTEVHSAHVHADARRYMVKKFLRDLWVEWRRGKATLRLQTRKDVPSAPANHARKGKR
jgi:hypothetical protein